MTSRTPICVRAIALLTCAFLIQPIYAQETSEQQKELTRYLAKLKASPDDDDLRLRIIGLVQSMDDPPAPPEDAEYHTSRGREILNQAREDSKGSSNAVAEIREACLRAVKEFQEVVNVAPWVAEGYNNLATAQEGAGLLNQAAQSLRFCLKAGALDQSQSQDKVDSIKRKIVVLEINWEKKLAQEKKDAEKKKKSEPIYVPPNF